MLNGSRMCERKLMQPSQLQGIYNRLMEKPFANLVGGHYCDNTVRRGQSKHHLLVLAYTCL